ncbi:MULTISPECIES: MFS transporter [unclassified Saccharothrix]|uniref:MFS transporter n=1 Tax=unclassified Saccharothrix TaxID=2593673 RepID=UPI00307CEB25
MAVTGRTWALAAATVAAGTSGYVVAAVLSEVAGAFGVTLGVAGQVITVFALAYAVGSPLLAVATARVGRRALLVAALMVMAVGNVGAAVADDFGVLLLARVVTACGAALTTPAATAVAAEVNGLEARGRAIAVVTAGLTAATLVGVPAGRVVAEWGGYRAAFVLTAVLCVVAAVVVRLAVPATARDAEPAVDAGCAAGVELGAGAESAAGADRAKVAGGSGAGVGVAGGSGVGAGGSGVGVAGGFGAGVVAGGSGAGVRVAGRSAIGVRVRVVADVRVQRLCAVSLLACLGTFAAYGFLGPLLTAAPTPWLLAAYGVGGVVGNVVGGVATDRFGPRGPLLVALGGTAVVLAVLPSALASPAGAAVVMVVWGGLFWAFNPPLAALLVEARPEVAGVVLALNASAIYLGIAGAGVLGGTVASAASVAAVPVVGAVVSLGAFLVALRVPAR